MTHPTLTYSETGAPDGCDWVAMICADGVEILECGHDPDTMRPLLQLMARAVELDEEVKRLRGSDTTDTTTDAALMDAVLLDAVRAALSDAAAQLSYIDARSPSGTTPAVLTRLQSGCEAVEALSDRLALLHLAVQHANDHADAAIEDMQRLRVERDRAIETVRTFPHSLGMAEHVRNRVALSAALNGGRDDGDTTAARIAAAVQAEREACAEVAEIAGDGHRPQCRRFFSRRKATSISGVD